MSRHHRQRVLALLPYYKARLLRTWREHTSSRRMLPDFLIAGAPKCGTSSLFEYLLAHPQVLAPAQGEIAYFTQYSMHSLDWYRSWFPRTAAALRRSEAIANKQVVTCDHTPSYMLHPRAAERIGQALPGAKVIFLLRDPVARAYSHYQHEFRTGHETMGFREALAAEPARIAGELQRLADQPHYHSPEYVRHAYLDQGDYRTKLEPFFQRFGRDNILVLKSEDFLAHPQDILDETLRFLGLDPFALNDLRLHNAGEYPPLAATDPELAHELALHFKPVNESLYGFLGRNFNW